MSAQRFIRCKHCGMPHEAQATSCPVTGKQLVPEQRKRVSAPPPKVAGPGYQWAHSVHPYSDPNDADPEATRSMGSLTGQVLEGKYLIAEPLGRGGMGVVYRAENTRIGKQVAIKILLRGYAKGGESERRFLREARIAGSIGHPNIVEVFDLGTLENGAPYQVMELLEGATLAARIRLEGALPIDEVLDHAEQVLSALEAAHERGIVHRDLKPENIFLHERAGLVTAKLLDFGVSKSLLNDHTLSLTQTGVVVGTPYYLAPEQARGERGVDHRVDIWAMGIVLYEALTGSLPFRADNYNALMAKILNTRPAPPRSLRPHLPDALENVILKALSFDPLRRFQTADDMLSAVRAVRGKPQRSSDRPFRSLPDARAPLAPQPSDHTLSDLTISVVQGPDDPTEISDSFQYSEIDAGRKSRG
ncbi:serine/threonine-protein kinase [Sandaracinus amylolyticus]|uniref:serine/threonine-protein kinase n=1 Tax=Sandaracinus amylolyticus TaxID=927083 RepID=UPI001F46B26C|nr:serine/threonine-protein kinase [Sandaracinus amylolyticus]UJR82053.1 Serine/threonine protein kinase PrkC, regulator of stationary phase [Sandaracinus amylolyticus]